jgi:hypothetical protein
MILTDSVRRVLRRMPFPTLGRGPSDPLGGPQPLGEPDRSADQAPVDHACGDQSKNGRPQRGHQQREDQARSDQARGRDVAAGGGPAAYGGDWTGRLPHLYYAPKPDGRPDPGEIVWTRVPFQEDPTQGKDRPVLLIAREGRWLLACPMTSKDHDRDAEQERQAGRAWVDVGAGPWDVRRRPSEVAIHRIIRLDPQAIRREGAVLDRAHFKAVVAALVGYHGRAH